MNARTISSSLLAVATALALGCGGTQPQANGPDGTRHANTLDVEPTPDARLPAEPEVPVEPAVPAVDPNAPLVTFELHNSHDTAIEFATDKGWSLVVSGFSGKPPNAKPIVLFPMHCTNSCDVTTADGCPVCKKPEKVPAEKDVPNREVVAAGATFELAWDAEIHAYEKTRVKGTRCDCFQKQPIEPGTYTLRACGLRVTTSAKATSKYQCVTTEVALPPSEPTRIRFDFSKP